MLMSFFLFAEAGFLAYRPSCIAAAAILSAANEIPNWSFVKPEHAESWCEGLRKVSTHNYHTNMVIYMFTKTHICL